MENKKWKHTIIKSKNPENNNKQTELTRDIFNDLFKKNQVQEFHDIFYQIINENYIKTLPILPTKKVEH